MIGYIKLHKCFKILRVYEAYLTYIIMKKKKKCILSTQKKKKKKGNFFFISYSNHIHNYNTRI
jgi:hypothetical protein